MQGKDSVQSPVTSAQRQRAQAILKAHSIFANCTDATLSEIVRVARSVKIARGETVYRQGEPGESLMIVLSGSLKATSLTTEAKEVVLGFVKAGALMGEIAALDGRERTATVVALEATDSLVIYRRDLMAILKSDEGAMLGMLEGLCGRLRATISLVESFTLETEGRVARTLHTLAAQHGKQGVEGTTIELKLTQRDLGSHTGLTRETVSRTLSAFRDLGVIDVRDSAIVVLDAAALADMAGSEG